LKHNDVASEVYPELVEACPTEAIQAGITHFGARNFFVNGEWSTVNISPQRHNRSIHHSPLTNHDSVAQVCDATKA
jgi:hypothetical protein